jgi:hypothetical protein
MAPVGGGWAGKNRQQHFSNRAKQHKHNEFGNESQMALLPRGNGAEMRDKYGHEQFVVGPQLKGRTLIKMAKMPDCCMCSQQFTVERGVTRLRVSQFSGEKSKWPPMVPRFLLHDAAIISIGGVSGKRKLLRGTTAARRCFAFWKASCVGAVHSNVSGPPFRRLDKGRNTCAQFGKKRW